MATEPKKTSGKQQTRRIKVLFKKYKEFLKQYYMTAPFKEPVIFLRRRNGHIEFHEGATGTEFAYKHSDGNERYIILDGKPDTMDYGDRSFRVYFCDEDHPFKLPEDPLITSEMFAISKDRDINTMKDWRAKEVIAKGKMWSYILWGIVAVIVAVTLFKMLVPQAPTPQVPVEQTIPIVKDLAINATGNAPIIIGG